MLFFLKMITDLLFFARRQNSLLSYLVYLLLYQRMPNGNSENGKKNKTKGFVWIY
jgi:hypothetical protein